MDNQTQLALKQLYDKYYMIQLMLFCLTEERASKWLKRKGKDGTIYINELEDVKIIEDSNGKLRAVQISNDYSCPIEDVKIIDIINEIRPKTKKVAKKKARPKKSYKVWFQVMGRYTDSNNIGYGEVQASTKEEALKFAEEDLRRGMFENIEIDCDGTLDGSESTDYDGNITYSWNVNWSGDGKHGRYYATGGPYAKSEEEAIELQKKDLTSPDWFFGFEDELSVDE